MPGRFSPLQLLLMLVAAAVAAAGWFYGWHWKRVATGAEPTHEEALIIDLQDQVLLLKTENERLTGLVRDEAESDPGSAPEAEGEPEDSELPSRD